MSVVKSPMGLMMGFVVIVMFLMPKLVENMGMHSILGFLTACSSIVPSLLSTRAGLAWLGKSILLFEIF